MVGVSSFVVRGGRGSALNGVRRSYPPLHRNKTSSAVFRCQAKGPCHCPTFDCFGRCIGPVITWKVLVVVVY